MRFLENVKTYHSISDFSAVVGTVATLGTFDGLHTGHLKVLDKLVMSARENQLESVVLTFNPHPRMILHPTAELKLLNTVEEKIKLFQEKNIDHLIIHPFTQEFSRLTAEEFVVDVLVKGLNIKKIIIGHDHRFGQNRTADITDLIRFGARYGFEVEQISAREIDEIAVSSTKIRKALSEGDIKTATAYLGYPYSFSGTVSKGQQLGRQLGFPTANIALEDEHKILPMNGVYAVVVWVDGKKEKGVMNIGTRPTVDGKNLAVEVHIFDFTKSIYNQSITVEVIDFIRKEQKFNSLESLKNQIQIDKDTAFAILKMQ